MPRGDRPPRVPIPDLVAVGIIRRPHGIRGEMSVEPLTDSPERFAQLDQVWLVAPDGTASREARIESSRAHKDRGLVKLAGIETPEQVRELAGWTLEIHPTEVRALDPDEYFLHDLPGLEVEAPDGRRVGVVRAVSEGGAGFLLTVEKHGGGAFEVPFAASICREIDLAGRRIVADLPEGLEDLERVEETEGSDEATPSRDPAGARLRVDLITIFPAMFDSLLREGIVAKAIAGGILRVRVWDLREFATGRHRSTDDEAYGGGAGMVMLAEPVFRCVDAILADGEKGEAPRVILTSPQGERFDHELARGLASERWLVIVCGRYEGFDERIREGLKGSEISVGDFVVSGGEIPAMLMVDAVARLVEGVVGDWNSVEADSFYTALLDHPHYTRPAELRGMKVPEVLLSGHAERIRLWRKQEALRATLEKRPELLERADLDEEAREMLAGMRGAPGAESRKSLKPKKN